jgi:magnesium-transporting ATPase (P-type)
VSKILTFEGEEENAYQAAPSSQKLPFHKLDDALSKVLFFFFDKLSKVLWHQHLSSYYIQVWSSNY